MAKHTSGTRTHHHHEKGHGHGKGHHHHETSSQHRMHVEEHCAPHDHSARSEPMHHRGGMSMNMPKASGEPKHNK